MENNNIKNHVEFISYSGEYPCLCNGNLFLRIDGIEYKFGICSDYPRFWTSGGNYYYDDIEYCEEEKWIIDIDDIPEQFRKYADEIDKVFNENVEWGCCGGCI